MNERRKERVNGARFRSEGRAEKSAGAGVGWGENGVNGVGG